MLALRAVPLISRLNLRTSFLFFFFSVQMFKHNFKMQLLINSEQVVLINLILFLELAYNFELLVASILISFF